MVPRWGVTDNRCQLCYEALGTLEHRSSCRATCPREGWPSPPKRAELSLGRIGIERSRLLQTRGLLALRLPAPPVDTDPSFHWHSAPPDVTRADVV
eukprot:128851-Karenia_brevis.AAC.1